MCCVLAHNHCLFLAEMYCFVIPLISSQAHSHSQPRHLAGRDLQVFVFPHPYQQTTVAQPVLVPSLKLGYISFADLSLKPG